MQVYLNDETFVVEINTGRAIWRSDETSPPRVITEGGEVPFTSAGVIEHSEWQSGLGKGIRSRYAKLPGLGGMEFETLIWTEEATGNVIFEWIPTREGVNVNVKSVAFPAPLALDGADSYTTLPYMQGLLLPNDWDKPFPALPFNGQLCSEAAYMPWWGQTRNDSGYIAIVEQPADAAYYVAHSMDRGGRVGVSWLPTLGRMGYKRTLRMIFPQNFCYVGLSKVYRAYAKERGLLVTLAEKAVRLPGVESLIGSAVAHLDIKQHVSPDSRYYDKEDPSKNDSVVSFAKRADDMLKISSMGIKKAYLHLDGWGQPGYDNQHPDYLPACEEAGGWEGLAALSKTCASLGFLFGIHDQYRDYYLDATTHDRNSALQTADGTVYEHAIWAGGRQNYLCPSLAPMYVKRNFEQVLANGVKLDATYLDVFTCNEPDECANPAHVVTRKESLDYRLRCFDYLISKGIIPSSEEIVDWAMPSLVFCHWAPYANPDAGIPVPLLNLVYHDCVIIPWKMGKGEWGTPEGQSGFLHAMLNGGIGYISPDACEDEVNKVRALSELHGKIAKAEMLSHEFVNGERTVQRVRFAGGIEVTVDFKNETYEVKAQ